MTKILVVYCPPLDTRSSVVCLICLTDPIFFMYLLQTDLHILVYLLKKCIKCWRLSAKCQWKDITGLLCYVFIMHAPPACLLWRSIVQDDLKHKHSGQHPQIALRYHFHRLCNQWVFKHIYTLQKSMRQQLSSQSSKHAEYTRTEASLRRIKGQMCNGILSYHFN